MRTSSFKWFQSSRAEERARPGPYTGKHADMVDRVSRLVAGDPAVSFSRNKGMAMGPNSGVAVRQPL